MAKEIKAIECPKCGSTEKTEIRTDVFRCDSCGTEYYLDNDDININYTYRNQPVIPSPVATPQAAKARVIIFAVIAILVIGIYTASHIFSGVAGSSSFTSPVTPGFSWGYSKSTLFQSAEGRPVLLIIGNRSYNGVGKDGIYLSFIDAQNGTELKSSFLGAGAAGSASTDFAIIKFSNGDIYVIVNKTIVYKADKTSYIAGNVTNTLFSGHPELSSGIANIQPVSDGDGFNLFTNDGKNMYYFPLINRVYNKDDFYHAQVTFKNALPGSKQKTAFTFSSKSFAYPDEKIQLLTYQYLDNGGGPKDEPLFRWDDDYGGSGIFTDADPHRKVLLYASQKEEARIISFKDFTPERLYFDPELLYYDADYILITFRPTAAENAATSLQCLNAHTAAIVFTTPLSSEVSNTNINDGVRYHDGFAISTSQGTYTTDMNGKLAQGYKMN